MERILTCIACPLGCQITVSFEDGKIASIKGNTCPRGKEYAENECTHPVRNLSTTMMCENGEVVAVKTREPIPKEHIFEAMKVINEKIARLPISVGDVIIDEFFGTAVVATQNKSK